jgi:hypothetical protein
MRAVVVVVVRGFIHSICLFALALFFISKHVLVALCHRATEDDFRQMRRAA